jgi:hypothetical protein
VLTVVFAVGDAAREQKSNRIARQINAFFFFRALFFF